MAVGFVASATSGSQASVASFSIGTLGTGARAGIVFVAIHNSATDIITSVTWNGVAMTLLYKATDTDTEPGVVKAYFLDNVTNGTITVNRTNNAVVTVGYAASISTASLPAYVSQVITRVASTQNTNADTSTTGTGASGEVAVDDGSPGSSSMRFAAAYSGAATPPLQGTNSSALQVLDSTAFGSRFVREATAGQGSRSVGFATGTTDDWAGVYVAVSEANPQTITLGLLDSGPALYAPSLSHTIAVPFLDASPALYAPTIVGLAASQSITLGLLDASNALYAPEVIQDQFLTVPLLDSGSALYAPAVLQIQYLGLPLLDARPIVFDTFSRTEPFGWGFADAGGEYAISDVDQSSVSGGVGVFTRTNPTGQSDYAYLPDVSVRDVDVTVKVKVNALSASPWKFTLTNGPAAGYGAQIELTTTEFWLRAVEDGGVFDSADLTSREGVPTVDTFYFMRLQVQDVGGTATAFQVRAWKEGNPQPLIHDINESDDTYLTASSVGIINVFPTDTGTFTASWDDLQATGDSSSLGVYEPTLQATNTITLGTIDASNALYAPTVIQDQFITLGLLDSGPAVYAPTVSPQAVTISLGLLDASPAVYAPTLTVGAVTITLGLLDSGPALYAPTLAQPAGAAQGITLDLLDAGNATYAPTLTVGAVGLTIPLLDGSPAVYAPTLYGYNTITIGLLDAASALYAPSLSSTQIVALGLLDGAPAVFAPTLSFVGEGGASGKRVSRRGQMRAAGAARTSVTITINAVVAAPTVAAVLEVNDDEVVLELLAGIL